MINWRKINNIWCIWPSRPIGVIEMIGGSYLSTTPQISYRRLLEGFFNKGFAIHAFEYIPGFDHQRLSSEAWKQLHKANSMLKQRISYQPLCFRLGHSLGCKLHLLSPDYGRNSRGLITLSFNNFEAQKSIPLLNTMVKKLKIDKEFNPSPVETLQIISTNYSQPRNLIISFYDDKLDQSRQLLQCLKNRSYDESESRSIEGNHLTPVSAGFRKNIFRDLVDDRTKEKNIVKLVELISQWCISSS